MAIASSRPAFDLRTLGLAAGALVVVGVATGYVILKCDEARYAKADAELAAKLGLGQSGMSQLVVGRGQEVDLRSYLVPGKTVVFDFFSEYCPPCRALKPQLERLPASRGDVVLVEVDINRPGVRGIDWDSPVARQYRLHSIPHLVVYGPDGSTVAEDTDTSASGRAWVQHELASL